MLEIGAGVLILSIAAFIQVGFFGQIRLMGGASDLVMICIIAWSIHERSKFSWIVTIVGGLVMSYISAMPMKGYIWMYLGIWLVIRFIKMRVWEMPLMLMVFVTILGTLIISAGTLGLLFLQNAAVNYIDAMRQIVVPSLVMNILLCIPIYAFLNDVINTIYLNEDME